MEDLKQKIKEVIEKFPEIINLMDEAKEWDSVGEIITNISTLANLVHDVCKIALIVNKQIGGVDREALIQIIAEMINEQVDLPWLPETVEQKVFEIAIGIVISMLEDVMHNRTVEEITSKI